MTWQIVEGECVEAMRSMPEASVDAVVCDPPYGLGFMGKEWDTIGDTGRGARARSERAAEVTPNGQGHSTSAGPYLAAGVDSLRSEGVPFQAWCEIWAREALRVLKPGGHLLAFGGTRTYHRLACAIEDAGFEIRDALQWLYGSGFPKSLDVSKAIDKAAGAERKVVGQRDRYRDGGRRQNLGDRNEVYGEGLTANGVADVTAPATADAERWQGWGTALKPAHEPVVVARKPLIGTVSANVLAHGTGALNIDGCRIGTEGGTRSTGEPNRLNAVYGDGMGGLDTEPLGAGRWPANVILDEEAAATGRAGAALGDTGGASRFFYCAKTSSAERNAGLDGFEARDMAEVFSGGMAGASIPLKGSPSPRYRNVHPTVKPIDLMRWLVRLVTPPGGTVLDPFTGSGTTGIACALERFEFVGIEREAEYAAIARARLAWWSEHPDGMELVRRLEAEREVKAKADAGQLDLFAVAQARSNGNGRL